MLFLVLHIVFRDDVDRKASEKHAKVQIAAMIVMRRAMIKIRCVVIEDSEQ